ncbi:MAG TPA: class III poly(R)-hydroxyalkanoic acid synthase subunit PhaC [Steroidobacteraceae bacterium]|nr:class III poly(R)-hydroxyalkanoic acid synthase subunit PhaC [Steroidobacteraceae bacterium]
MSTDPIRALAAAQHAAVGASPRDVIFERDKLTLYRYRPIARPARAAPLLVVYALVNRPYMLDLQPDRSLIRGLLGAGLDVHLVDWGYPDGADRFTTLEDYLETQLHACVAEVLRCARVDSLNLLGVCQGGTFSVCYGALHPERIAKLVTMVTPIDFQTPADLLSKWVRGIDVGAWIDDGNIAGETLNQAFLALMPWRLLQQKYVKLLGAPPDARRLENFVRMERWITDSPDLAGTALREFLTWFYQENRLVHGTLQIGGRTVDLSSLRRPILNLYGARDHLVPPAASAALERLTGSTDYTGHELDLGHIGMYVSDRAQRQVPPLIADWLTCTRRR